MTAAAHMARLLEARNRVVKAVAESAGPNTWRGNEIVRH